MMLVSQLICLSDISSIMPIVLIINLTFLRLINMQSNQQNPFSDTYIDSHTHLLDYPEQTQPSGVIENAIKHNVKHIVVNTTTTKQFDPLVKLLAHYQHILIAGFGIHPCFVKEQQQIQETKCVNNKVIQEGMGQANAIQPPWIEQLQNVLRKQNSYSVGEIGLDFRKDILQNNPKDLQMHYFNTQLALAIRMGRPATIHCVRAHGQMLKLFKDLNKKIKPGQDRPHLIMHSYGGSEQITKSMLKLQNINFFFSLSLRRSQSLCSVIPVQNLICQTDSPCQNNIPLLTQQNRLHLNTYLEKIKKSLKSVQTQLQKSETNEPLNVISNIKSLVKYYKMDEEKFTSIIFKNSLRAFKFLK